MCGIVGAVTQKRLDSGLISSLHAIQRHRGPDARGDFYENLQDGRHLSLLHQRLSIIDLSDGSQPMANKAKDVWIVFNGEIFNHEILRKELVAKGYGFSTDHSDTEVLIHMYSEYGQKMLPRLNGMFAFCIFDQKNQKLFMARDRFGIKPLYYMTEGDAFYFASELKTLRLFSDKANISYTALSHYLSFQFVPAPLSIFENIFKLPAAHYMWYDIKNQDIESGRYWEPNFSERNTQDLEEGIRNKLNEAVRSWSMSDVEVGASLSGGLDSSAIVALYARESERQIKSFSLGFTEDGANLDEMHLASMVADQYDAKHFEFRLSQQALLAELDQMVYHLDEPYGGGLPSWFVYRMMRGRVKVGLTGTGGDELFGNYGKWVIFESGFLNRALCFLKKHQKTPFEMPMLASRHPFGALFHSYFSGPTIAGQLLHPDIASKIIQSPEDYLEKLYSQGHSDSIRDRVFEVDIQHQLPEEFLHMTDRFSMAHSIEARVPMLDNDLVDYVNDIPASIRTSVEDPKHLFRKSVGPLLPHALRMAPKKGFVIPQSAWLRKELKNDVLRLFEPVRLKEQGIFSENIYYDIVLSHLNGQRELGWQLWTLFMFQLWYKRFVQGDV